MSRARPCTGDKRHVTILASFTSLPIFDWLEWKQRVSYRWHITHRTTGLIRVSVHGFAELEAYDSRLKGGRVGAYSLSQVRPT